MVGYTPSSFPDSVFASEMIEVGLKRGISDHPALMNSKTGANEEGENEGETHAATIIPTWPNFPPAQQCHYSTNIISTTQSSTKAIPKTATRHAYLPHA